MKIKYEENRMKEKQPHPHLNFKLNCMYITDMVCTRIWNCNMDFVFT